MLSERYRNAIGTLSKGCRNYIGIISECYRNAIEMLSERYWNAIETLSERYRNAIEMLSECYRISIGMSSENTQQMGLQQYWAAKSLVPSLIRTSLAKKRCSIIPRTSIVLIVARVTLNPTVAANLRFGNSQHKNRQEV